jgi:hypothetical protein
MVNETLFTIAPGFIDLFDSLVVSIKALGIAIVFYLIFSVVNTILIKRRENEMRLINKNLEDIKKLLGKKK